MDAFAETAKQPELRRDLGPWAAAAIVVGTTIGSGIFLVPTDMVQAVGSVHMVFLVWIVGGLMTLFGALTYAELAAAMPGAGGEYVYLNAAYGPFFGFIYGWTQMWVAKAASIATLATGFFGYLANFAPGLTGVWLTIPVPIGPNGGPFEIRYGQLLAISVVLFLGGVNYVGVKVGGNVQVFVTILKIILIGGLIGFGLFGGAGNTANLSSSVPAPGGFTGFFAALVAALWAYDGWNNGVMVGSEIKNPQRNLPLTLVFGTLAIMGIYLAANIAYFYVLSGAEVAAAEEGRVAAVMMRHVMGPVGASLVSVAAMLSIFAALNGSILSGSRVPYAMARDGYFFASAARVHPQFRTPFVSIILLSVWSSLMVLSGRYKELYTIVIFPSWVLYGMTAAAAIVLRKKRPDMPRPYRVVGYPVVPVLFVIVASILVYATLQGSPRESAIGLVLIAAGLPFYFH
ncbi:MAG: amino acid permease, partial [Bryobacteraceae bacterium]